MRIRATGLLCALWFVGLAGAAEPNHTALDTWLSGLKSLRAQFTQTIKAAQGHTTDPTSGELLVLRPVRH